MVPKRAYVEEVGDGGNEGVIPSVVEDNDNNVIPPPLSVHAEEGATPTTAEVFETAQLPSILRSSSCECFFFLIFFFNHLFISSLFLAGGGERKGEGRKKVFGWVDRKTKKV